MSPLVLVHGFMGGSRQWTDLRGSFDGSLDTVAVDLPGFGCNTTLAPVASIPAFAQWVVETVAAQGISRFHLLGHSMGGMIAQEIAARFPEQVDRLVLYGTGVSGVLPGRFETIETSRSRAEADGARTTARRIAATWFLDRQAAPAFETCAQIAEQCSLPAILAGLDAMQSWPGLERLDAIRTKTLVIWGDQDRTYPWAQTEQLWRSIPDTNLAVLPGCAHAAHLEKPTLFAQCISDFLERPLVRVGSEVPADYPSAGDMAHSLGRL